jgi:hypothetical protein
MFFFYFQKFSSVIPPVKEEKLASLLNSPLTKHNLIYSGRTNSESPIDKFLY